MSRRGENIFKRKDGRWEGRYFKEYTPGGVKKYGFLYGKTYREVKEKVANAKSAMKEAEKGKASDCASFAFYANEWITRAKPFLKESTVVRYNNLLKLHILPEFGKTAITEIRNGDVEQFRNSLLCDGRQGGGGLSPKYVTDILSVIKMVQRYASMQNLPLPLEIHSVSVKRKLAPLRVFSPHEQDLLYSRLLASESNTHLGILIAMFTGMRIGEICALKWEDIDFLDRVISVRHTMPRIHTDDSNGKTKVILSTPKSSCSIRKIPIPPVIYDKLLSAAQKKDTYVLTGMPDCFIEPRTMHNHYKKFLSECGISDAKFHTLRHTFATRCIELGFDAKTLSEILGHYDVKVTLNNYVHPSMSQKQISMGLLSDAFAKK